MFDLRLKIFKNDRLRRNCAPSTSSISHHQSHIPTGMSLIEVLISMFVLLFGLMGVAAIFPVGNHYVVEGEKYDLASGIAQNAFEELRARGMLQPEFWMYANVPLGTLAVPGSRFVMQKNSTDPEPGTFNMEYPPSATAPGPGNVFVIDPLGSANVNEIHFPFALQAIPPTLSNMWYVNRSQYAFSGPPYLPGTVWPVRRITLPQAGNFPMATGVAETIFRLRDDLSVDQPKKSDVPSIQRWDVDATNSLLRRQYKGNYSWLATIVPTTRTGVDALQPSHDAYGQIPCDVSVVVFRKRDETPSDTSERFTFAELLPGNELVIYALNTDPVTAKADLDAAVEDIRPGNWIALTGINRTTGDFIMKWYRILSLDDETVDIDVFTLGGARKGRRAMLIGPDWPATSAQQAAGFVGNLTACTFPGAISVVTKPLRMEATSLWSLE